MRLAFVVSAALASSGCTALAAPMRPIGPGELALAYDQRLQVLGGAADVVATEPDFDGLEAHVDCSPQAVRHAAAAKRHGRRARRLAWAGGVLGVTSLGGLGGLAARESNPAVAGAVVGSGLALGLIGVVLAGTSRAHRNRAAGNAVDAVNIYNDEARGGQSRCQQKRRWSDRDLTRPDAAPTQPPAPSVR